MKNKLKFLKRTIYKLKRSYGLPVDLHKIDQHSVDPITGDKTTVLEVFHINKVVILRAREFRSFVYDLAYISANKDFTTGGFFDPEDRKGFIDADDLNGYQPNIGDFFIFQNERYDIKELYHFENDVAYGFFARKLRGADIVRIVANHTGFTLEHEATSYIVPKLERSPSSILNLTQELKEVP